MTDRDSIDLPRLARDERAATLTVRRPERTGEPTRLTFSLSSEAPVERWFGTEVLSHAPGAIRLDRLTGGAVPLLFNHEWGDPVGMIDGASLQDGRLQVDAHFFETARAREVLAMVEGGLRNVSVGYEIHKLAEDPKTARYTATDWEPFEGSIVTVPADPSVGIGRAEDRTPRPVRIVRASQHLADPAQPYEAKKVPDLDHAPAGTAADTAQPAAKIETRDLSDGAPPNALEIERERKDSITKLCRANHIDGRTEQHWIRTGASLNKVADELVAILQTRSETTDAPVMLGMEKREVNQYSLLRAMRAVMSKDWSKAGLELSAHKALMDRAALNPRSENSFFVPMDVQVRSPLFGFRQPQTRDMTAAGVSGSGYLVSTDNLAGAFIDLLRNQSVVMSLGATRLSGMKGNVTIPRQTAASTAYWLANENTAITESQPTFGQVTLSPKHVAALTEISHQLMQQSDPSAEQLVVNDLSRSLAIAADVAALRGSGNNGQPQGIVGTSGVGSFDTDGTSTYADVVSAQEDVFAANALGPGCAYVADGASAALLMGRSRFANTDTPIWDGSLLQAQMAGFPARGSNQMEANTMLFGNWPTLVIAEWGVLEIMLNPYSDFTRGLSAIRAWYTMDVAMRYPAAFTYDATVA